MTKTEALEKIKELEEYISTLDKKIKIGFEDDEIFLLSLEEYERYKDVIPHLNCWWWLRSSGDSANYASYVNLDGYGYIHGYTVDSTSRAVRPALKFLKYEIPKPNKGEDYFMFNEVRWKIIDKENEIAISEMPITFDMFDNKSNDYENSYIRKYLNNWLKNR